MNEIIFSYKRFTFLTTGATIVPAVDVENAATITIGNTTNKSLVTVNLELSQMLERSN